MARPVRVPDHGPFRPRGCRARCSGGDLQGERAAQSDGKGKVIAVVQPHRYTRVRDLFSDICTCFNSADTVIVADIYSAGEDPIEGITADKLVEGLQSAGHRHVLKLESPETLSARTEFSDAQTLKIIFGL